MHISNNSYLPGDKPHEKIIDEIIRVDHSGEYGAQKIYQGQILATKHLKKLCRKFNDTKYDRLINVLQKMYDSEIPHYEFFQNLMNVRKSRPSLMLPVWSVFGFLTGYLTGIVGEKSAMALTVGVEDIIGHHYNEQLQIVKNIIDKNKKLNNNILLHELYSKIKQFMHDELEHLNIGIQYNTEKICGYFYFNMLVKSITKIAISIAKNV